MVELVSGEWDDPAVRATFGGGHWHGTNGWLGAKNPDAVGED